jgi:hypothetical protein
LDLDFAGGRGNGDFIDFCTAYFGFRTAGYGESVFGSVGVVFFICDLICSESWCWWFIFSISSELRIGAKDLDVWCIFLQTQGPSYGPQRGGWG